jgi:deoxyribodipyrimidine photolyase-related protein
VDTVWVLGDQLNRAFSGLAEARPDTHRVLFVHAADLIGRSGRHRQRTHLVVAAMRRFAGDLLTEGFEVDEREAPSLAAGLAAHRERFRPRRVVAMEPSSRPAARLFRRRGVETVRSNQFLCHYEEFAAWAENRNRLRNEDFYRWQRRRLGYLMDGDQPAGGRWNFDAENRRPPPADERPWPRRRRFPLDDLDREVIAALPAGAPGADPAGWWPTSRRQALERLEEFVDGVLPHFGPWQDAMLGDDWHLAHSLLSPALNIGLLRPAEVCDAVEGAFRAGRVPIESAEGFVRQVIGWREYVWGLYWLWGEEYEDRNEFGAALALPASFRGAPTRMRCVAEAVAGIEARGYAHHIQRLMVLGNLALLAGVRPGEMVRWMRDSFVDGADWVMLPNVIGMALHADGGMMATKPYAAGGGYIDRMSDSCKSCPFDPKRRTGTESCPFTVLYWDFLDRHRDRLGANRRMVLQVRNLDRIAGDLAAIRTRAAQIRQGLVEGSL